MSEIPVNKTKCPKCGTELNIHAPAIVAHHDAHMSQVSLIPSWSMDERTCRGCGCIVAPRIRKIDIEIVPYEPVPKREPSRIIPPGPLPLDINERLKKSLG